MSDIAPFVAAAIRDKTVVDLMEENNKLKRKLEKITTEANTIKIKKGNGDDEVVYAKAEVDKDGWEMEDDVPRWQVDLAESSAEVKCHYSDLFNVQISIGDTTKALFGCDEDDAIVCHDTETQQVDVALFGTARCTILYASIGQLSVNQRNAVVRNAMHECDPEEFEEIMDQALGGRESAAAKACYVTFDAIRFNRHAHTCWHIPDWEPDIR